MTDQDFETLGRFFDGAMSPEEEQAFQARLSAEPELADALASLTQARTLFKVEVEEAANAFNFNGFYEAIEGRLATEEKVASPAALTAPQGPRWLTPRVWVPIAAALAAGFLAAVLWWPQRGAQPSNTTPNNVVLESLRNSGSKTVLISQPAEDGGATVIWLLEGEDEKPAGADAAVPNGEDPI